MVKAVYTYEPEHATSMDEPIAERPNLSPGISLLVWVNRKSSALSSLQASLCSAMADEWKELGCPKANASCSMLDIQVVDDAEVEARTGYGALIHSVYVRPIELWRR